MKHLIIIIFVLTGATFLTAFHQFDQWRTVPNRSFGTGEKVEYRVHYGFINAAEAKVEIGKSPATVNNRPCFKVHVSGRTVGAFDLISRVRDSWRSYIDTSAILPHMFEREIQENKYRKNETVMFNHKMDQAVASTKNETKTYNVPNNIHDIISGYFYLRTMNFERFQEGEVIEIPTFFGGDVYKLRFRYAGRDVIKTKFGKTKVLRLNPLIPDKKFFKGDEPMHLWVSDDSNKIPVKATVELVIGSLEMDLKSYKGLKKDLNFF